MFHVKHRRRARARTPLAVVLALLALLAGGCATDLGSPDGWAAPVEADGVVLVQAEKGELVAVRLGDGPARIAWRFPEDAALPAGVDPDDLNDIEAFYATPVFDDGTVYMASFSGEVMAVDITGNGPRLAWIRKLTHELVASPVLHGDVLYVPTEGGELLPLDAESGAMGESLATGAERFWSRPAVSGSAIYVAGLDRHVRAAGVQGGEQWVLELEGAVAGDLLLDGETLFVGALDRRMYALDVLAAGAERWRFQGDGWFWARPLLDGDTLYATTTNGSVYALDARSGDEQWRFNELDNEIRAQPVLVGGILVVAMRDGVLFGIDPSTGVRQWQQTLAEGKLLADPLVLESGILYVTDRGDLISVDPRSGATTTVFEGS
ncbi:MAG: PQQ-binding-like beta-propeller repeat protein [Chloroflexi bacterium]|nr:PQQ-binding-like beta-propeller repeat protein [Chloroflexota bacterium]